MPDKIFERPAELLQNLIRFDTTNPPGNELDCVNYIDTLLTGAGCETTILAKDSNRPNLLSRLKGRGDAPTLLLYGHVDVVTTAKQNWKYPPFEGRIIDDALWGRGALDMKGGIAMMLAAFLRAKSTGLTPSGDVIFAALSDEEAGGDYGAMFLVEEHPDQFEGIRYALGEFGGFSLYVDGQTFYPIQVAEKQMCWLKAVITGPGGHGSRLMRGGTMANLGDFLSKLDMNSLPVHITPVARDMFEGIASSLQFPKNLLLRQVLNPTMTDSVLRLLGEAGVLYAPILRNTVNATIVTGGEKINVIPSEIEVELDGRSLPGYGPNEIIREIKDVVGEDIHIENVRHDPCPVEPDLGLFDTLGTILSEADPGSKSIPLLLPAVTDARFFSRLGIQTYGFTPMKLEEGFNFFETAHAANEHIPVDAVNFGTQAIYKVIERFR
jgi:acetylornithine deacetylase/succinyl-diaminopimelate desuccinylase-like protein